MNESGWTGDAGKRYGYVETSVRQEVLAGFFAHEGHKTAIQYDDQKQLEDRATESFEHLFFAIFTDTSQLLLQHRNIYGYDDLSLPEMRSKLLESLGFYLQKVGIAVNNSHVEIVKAGILYTQEDMLNFFSSNNAIRLDVRNLRPELIPQPTSPNYNLYNPKDDWNPITWGAVADTLEVGTKNIILEADESDENARLNGGPLPKAMARIGQIEEVKARSDNGRVIYRKRNSDEEITLELPDRPSIITQLMETVLGQIDSDARVDAWTHRLARRDEGQFEGTMFDGVD